LVKKKKKKTEVLKETQQREKAASANPVMDKVFWLLWLHGLTIKKLAYDAALKKIKGEKVYSSTVLKKQIKQDKKKKEKSASQWAKRKEESDDKFKEKQRVRMQNIKEHVEKRKEKKILKRVKLSFFNLK
jgi:hypothetical protein